MQEQDQKHVEEQLKALDEDLSRSRAVSANHRLPHDPLKTQPSSSSTTTSDSSPRPSRHLKQFQPRGTVEFPLKFEDGHLLVQPNAVRTSLSCNIPGQRWNAKFTGSSLVRGPMGAATGSMLLSYDIMPRKLQAISQLAIGDRANVMFGAIHHTSTAWYGVGIFCTPTSYIKTSNYAFQMQSEQRLENATVTLKFFVPTKTMRPNTTLTVHSKTAQMEMGMVKSQPQVTLSLSPRLSSHRTLKLSCQLRKSGVKVDALVNQTLGTTSKSKIGIGVRHDSRQGLAWLFTWIRGDITIKIPIFILSNGAQPLQYVCSCYLAAISYLIQECIADLWNLNTIDADSVPKQPDTTRAKARADAEKEMFLMERQANSRRAAEEKKSGLVITKAVYYVPLKDSWDVTTQLQFWTEKSSLDLPALSKQHFLGFYKVARDSSDVNEPTLWWEFWKPQQKAPSKLERRLPSTPLLKVQYDYAGSSYEIEINDEESLSLPSNMAREIR